MKLGIDYDINKTVYEKMDKIDMEAFKSFFDTHLKDKNYTFLIIGNKAVFDMDVISKLGEIKEIGVDELFNE